MILGYKKLTLKGPHQNGDPIGHRLWRWARWRLKGLWPQKSKVQARPGTGKDVAGCHGVSGQNPVAIHGIKNGNLGL